MINIAGLKMDFKNREKWVAIIGSRDASDDEMEAAYKLARSLVSRGDIIVSGLAKGIDSAGHQGAIDGGGKTIALVSSTKEMPIYPPENKGLAEKIKNNGCIIYPFDSKPRYQKSGLSQPVKRLMERSILNAYLCPNIIIVKNNDSIINGGTRWATSYGMSLGHNVFRYDCSGKFHKNPRVDEAKVHWLPELNIIDYLDRLDSF